MKVTTDALEKQDNPPKGQKGNVFLGGGHIQLYSLSFLTDLSLVLCFDIIEASEASKEHIWRPYNLLIGCHKIHASWISV